MTFILGNILAMCFEEDNQKPSVRNEIIVAYVIFSFIFILEAIIKIFCLGFMRYIQNNWNK